MKNIGYLTIDEYLEELSEEQREVLEGLRKMLHALLPGAGECISYQMPTLKVNGKNIISFAAWKEHYALYPHSGTILPALVKAKKIPVHGGTKSAYHFSREDMPTKKVVQIILEAKMKSIKK